ncbi:MAG: VCBS repeat-containing protein, partial [Planctomycetes bacterium]|nr:VCBS repeat-containing protein [Planctomycetota bacterium]
DGDGLEDLVTVLATDSISVAFGRPSGTFSATNVTPLAARGVQRLTLADVNADGALDAVVCYGFSNAGSVGILLGTGTGTFLPEVTLPTGWSAGDFSLADLDGDGDLDLAVALLGSPEVDVFEGVGDGSFLPYVSLPQTHLPGELVAADFDGDGHRDLVVANDDAGSTELALLLGNGSMGFALPLPLELGASPEALRAADLTGDGLADLVATT